MNTDVRRRAKRKTKLAKERAYAARVAIANRFPEIIIDPSTAPPPLVDAVRTVLKRIRFDHETLLPEIQALVFREAKERGFPATLSDIERAFEGVPGLGRAALVEFTLTLGELLYQELPREVLDRYSPFHCVYLLYGQPGPDQILASFRSLLTAKTSGGTAYYSRRKPTLNVGGDERIVAFSQHAIERICDRTVGNWRSYAGSGDAFAYLNNCVFFEACEVRSGEILFTFFNECSPGFFSHTYAQEVVGELDPRQRYYYRVGYCPAVVEGDLIKAVTLLTPGMRGTPEHEILRRSSLPEARKREMITRAGQLTYRELATSGDFSVLKWYHENGVPQVVTLDRDVFDFR
jgi:hypothetical protein